MVHARVPQVDKILRHPLIQALESKIQRPFLADLVREELDLLRQTERAADDDQAINPDRIAQTVADRVGRLLQPSLNKVINGTGVVLNTNLGRAPISTEALQDLLAVGNGYCNLEIDLNSGKRGKRSQRIERLLQLLTGAEAAIAVNNNAAAVLLCVNALARAREVVVSRGELVEIGGSFRVPDVIESGGAILKEVGTTNRTRIADFRNAVNEQTGLFLRCHRSNFEVRGFTEEVSLEELVRLSAETGIPLVEDLGSGVLVDLVPAGLLHEPTVREVVATGCGLVCFSGDKLLGGPQAGIIVGNRALVERLAKHPLYRALRLDKLTIAILERTLAAYLTPQAQKIVPVINMLFTSVSDIQNRAEKFAATICDTTNKLGCEPVSTHAAAGGGSLPGEAMPSHGISLTLPGVKPNKLAEMLRRTTPPVVAIVQADKVILDFRTISATDEQLLLKAILSVIDFAGV